MGMSVALTSSFGKHLDDLRGELENPGFYFCRQPVNL